MTLDRDPMANRLVEAWLDEGPRTFSPRLLDRTLAEIHATPRRRQRPLPWSTSRMNLTFFTGLAGAAVLAVMVAAGSLFSWLPATILGPAATPTATPSASGSPAPSAVAGAVFLNGDVPFEGTDWLLVGRSDTDWGALTGGPAFVTPGLPAWLRISDGAFTGSTGCNPADGAWPVTPDGDQTTAIRLAPNSQSQVDNCHGTEDGKIATLLGRAGAFQVTRGAYDLLASGLTDTDLDPPLLAHYQQHPDLVRLIIRDQSGEGTLVYAPVAPGFVTVPPVVGLVGPLWGLVGYVDGTVPQGSPVSARTAGMRFATDGTFAGSLGCGAITGRWGVEVQGAVEHGPWVVDEATVPADCTVEGAQSMLDALRSVDPSSITVTTDAAAALPASWDDTFGPVIPEPSTVLVLRNAAGDPALLYLQLADDAPEPSASPAPTAAPTFLAGKQPLVGTMWRLVGRGDPDHAPGAPSFISPVGDRPATLRFAKDERLAGDSGCRVIQGTWDASPTGAETFPADISAGAWHEIPCTTPAAAQDKAVIHDLGVAGAMQLTTGGFDLLASGLADADLDAGLLAHYQANPDLVRLIIRDQSGEGTLIYAPVAPDLGDLLTGSWEIAGFRSDEGSLAPTADPSVTRIRFDPDGTFTATAGCARIGGIWGKPALPDTSPVPGPVQGDIDDRSACDGRDPETDTLWFLLGEADLSLGVTQTHDPASWLYPDDASDALDALFAASPDADWILIRDADQMEVLVLRRSDDAEPEPTPSAVPVPDVAFLAGDVPLSGTIWKIVGYRSGVTEDGPTYEAVLPGTTAYIRFADAGLATGAFGACEQFTALTGDLTGTGARPVIRETDAAYTAGCPAAATRQAVQLERLFGEVASLDRTDPGIMSLTSELPDERIARALRDHFTTLPEVGHVVLRRGGATSDALLVLAPLAVDVGPQIVPFTDPAPNAQPAATLAGDRALTDDAWLLVGWRDATGRMVMDRWDWPTQLVFTAGDGTASGGFTGTIPCGAIDGQWAAAILDAATGTGPFTFTQVKADPASDCNASLRPQIDGLVAGLEGAATVSVAQQEVQLDIAGVAKTEMDPWLWSWLAANQDARLLVVKDAAGATSLIFAPTPLIGADG